MTKLNGYNVYSPFKTINITTPQASSSSLSEVKLASINIPANTFGVGDVLKIEAAIKKTGSNGLSNFKIYWNSADSISSPTPIQIMQYLNVVGASTNPIFFIRRASIDTADGTGDGTQIHTTTENIYQDYIRTGSFIPSTLSIDWTIDSWLIISGYVNSSLDSINCQWFRITNS